MWYMKENEVVITNTTGYASFTKYFHTRKSIQQELGCSVAWAYRIMQRLPWVWVTDEPACKRFRAVRRELVREFLLTHQRGNPNWRNSAAQSELARRRW